jgi:hypothetical protein
MIKIDGLTNITPEELNHLSTEAIPKVPLVLFNECLRILNQGSIGELICDTQEIDTKKKTIQTSIDPISKSDKVYNEFKSTVNPILYVYRFIRLLFAIYTFLFLFSYINLKWYRFFVKNPEYQNKSLANQFSKKIEQSKGRFPLSRMCYRKVLKIKARQQSLDVLALKLNTISPKFHLRLISEQDLFHKFVIRLYEVRAIDNIDHFKEVFNGFIGNQVNWYFDKESIIFMIELLNLKDKIRITDRSKDISICFFNAKDGLPFDPDDLNTVASRKGLSKFNGQRFQKIINNPSDNDIPKIYSIYKEIYRS